ncbi:MAG: serine kinase [Pseudomonadota bacterium]
MADPFNLTSVPEGAHVRATTVAWGGRALLIVGPSGAGKSSLALELMALGAALVADDITELRDEGRLIACAPAALPSAIEARGLGLLKADLAGQQPAFAALDLTRCSAARLPQPQEITLLGHSIPLLHKPASGPVAAMLLQYLKQNIP